MKNKKNKANASKVDAKAQPVNGKGVVGQDVSVLSKPAKKFEYDLLPEGTTIHLESWNGSASFLTNFPYRVGKKIIGKELDISVSYPFHKALSRKIKLGGYQDCMRFKIYASDVVNEIQDMLKEMYNTAKGTEHKIPGLLNELCCSPIYGDCMHGIGDLWLERLEIDIESGTITPLIGS